MPFLAATSAPAATVTTTAETLAANIPATPITPPPNATAVIVRGRITVTTGSATTSLFARLRLGQSNTTTNLIDTPNPVDAGASGSYTVPFEFQDTNLANIGIAGYSLTIVMTNASGNGTIAAVDYEVDYAVP
jgi:hypothetical protein